MSKLYVGLDFGTTNSAIGVATPDGSAKLATFTDQGRTVNTFRSILYFTRAVRTASGKPLSLAGPEAIECYLDAEEKGRLIQSIKSYLPSRLFTRTNLFGYQYTLEELIAIIIRKLKQSAESQFGELGDRVVVGRPVEFAGTETVEDEEFALSRLRSALEMAGFNEVIFEYEPVAAAYYYETQLTKDELVLIGDFGGGTSDFTLIKLGPSSRRSIDRRKDILGNEGVGLAGDIFDSRIVKNLIAPELGAGTHYRSLGKLLPIPYWLFEKLSRWHHVSFLHTRQTLEMLRQLKAQAEAPEKLTALTHLIKSDLGYQMYRSVEQTKVSLSSQTEAKLNFSNAPIRIDQSLTRSRFEEWLVGDIAAIEGCVQRLLDKCNVKPQEVGSVFLTGGSAFVPAVRRIFEQRFGSDRLRGGEELTTVAKGLALRAANQAA